MADKDLTIKIRTQGDPSGAKGVSQAIDGIGATSTRTAEIVTRDQRRMADAAASAAAAMRAGAVADTGGGRSWSIPGAGAVSARGASGGGGSISVPTVAPSVAPVSVPRPASPSGGGAVNIAPVAEETADASRRAAQALDDVADSAQKIKPDKLEETGKAAEAAGSGAESSAADMITAFDSVSNEITDVIDGWKELKGEGQEGGQTQADGMQKASDAAAALTESINAVTDAETAAADAAMEAEAAKAEVKEDAAEAQEESAEATEEGAEAEAESAGDVAEHIDAVVQAVEEKKKATKEATEEDKKGGAEAEKASGKMGQAAMAAAQFVDDAQYGLKGIMNNIPQVVQALGLGSGVAGVLGIAAVALNQLIDKFDIFGSAAPEAVDKTVKELNALTAALARARNEAAQNAEDWNKAQKNGLANKKELEEIATKYKAIADNIRHAADARRALNLAMLDESDAELGLKLSEIELQRSKGQITDIEAEEQSQNTRRAYMKAQAELTKQQAEQDFTAKEASIQNMREELEARVAYVQKMKKLSADLVPDKDFDVMGKTKDVAMAQLEEMRKKARDADEKYKKDSEEAEKLWKDDDKTLEFGWEFSPMAGKWGVQKLEMTNSRELYVRESKEEADKTRLALERAEKYARESLDSWKKTKDAREAAGPELQDFYKMNDHLSGEEKKIAGGESAIKQESSSLAVERQNARVAERALRLRQATEENLGQGKLAGMQQSKQEEERQKQDKEREYREQLKDEADAKMWDEMEKKDAREKEAREKDAARRRIKLPEESAENSISERRKKFEEDKAKRRREEERARELALEKEKQDRLSLTIQDGDPYKKPADRSAPVRPGFPRATIPAEIDRPSPLPPDPQITGTPVPMPGDETKAITGPLDDFLARKGKGASTIGGGDARLSSLKAATDALRDGGTKAEYQKLIDVLNTLVDTVLGQRKEDRAEIARVRKEAEKNVDRLKKSRN